MPTLDRSRVPQQQIRPTPSATQPRGTSKPPQPTASVAVDHWSYVLFYSMGVGTLAVAALLFTVLIAVWLYGQFVWTFTHWDLSEISLAPFESLAYLVIAVTFLGGTCAGLWMFSGAAWKNQRNNATSTRRLSR